MSLGAPVASPHAEFHHGPRGPGRAADADEVSAADLLVLAVAAVVTVPVLASGHRISRLEVGAFVAAYLGYLMWLTLG
jgi:hypothetical protein